MPYSSPCIYQKENKCVVSLAIGSDFAKKLTLFNPEFECFIFPEKEKEFNDRYTGRILVDKARINKPKPVYKINVQTKVHQQVIDEVSEKSSDDNSDAVSQKQQDEILDDEIEYISRKTISERAASEKTLPH